MKRLRRNEKKRNWMIRRGMIVSRLWPALREDGGNQLVEFSLSLALLLTLMFGVLDCSRAMFSYHFATYAAQEGARYAIVRGSHWKTNCATSAPPNFTLTYGCVAAQSDVQNYVKSLALPGINQSNMTVTAAWPGTTPDCSSGCTACSTTNKQGCMVKVRVAYQFGFMMPFLPKNAISFSGTSVKAIQE